MTTFTRSSKSLEIHLLILFIPGQTLLELASESVQPEGRTPNLNSGLTSEAGMEFRL